MIYVLQIQRNVFKSSGGEAPLIVIGLKLIYPVKVYKFDEISKFHKKLLRIV